MAPRRPGIHHRAEELAAVLPPLLVAADRVATTVAQGVHGRRRVGQGETFWQFRRYQPGDSAQAIDWRQSAKSQPVYVRETEWEAAQTVWLWRDPSASMDYRSTPSLPDKAERGDLLLLALVSLLIRGGEHVALLGSGPLSSSKAPATGRAALGRIAAEIEEGRSSRRDGTPRTDGLPAFESLPRHARVVLIGDFLAPLGEVKSAIEPFANHGIRGHLVQVLDPAEESFPFTGRLRFEGPEQEGETVLGRAETVRRDYRAAIARHRDGLAALARSADWTFTTHHTDRPPETALLATYVALAQPRPWTPGN